MASFLLKLSSLFILLFVSRCSKATTLIKVLLPNAVNKGAVCLDGSPPGYYIHHGTTAPRKWIIHFQGGGWCGEIDHCMLRTFTSYGSSKSWSSTINMSGIMSDNCTINPHFCGWTMVQISHCDGSSFASNRDALTVTYAYGITLYFRGFKILETVMDALLATGVKSAEEVLFTGCSAGGLAIYLHADYLRSRIPAHIPVRAMADAGYFIDVPNVNGYNYFGEIMRDVFDLHNCTGGVNQDCMNAYAGTGEEWKCFMAQYTYRFIKTPLFSINSRYDTYQLFNTLESHLNPAHEREKSWKFGIEFLMAAYPTIQSRTNGVFIDSCPHHCQTLLDGPWTTIKVMNQTMGDSLYGWMTKNRRVVIKEIDCDGPSCNPTC